jgi:hypothetical protein
MALSSIRLSTLFVINVTLFLDIFIVVVRVQEVKDRRDVLASKYQEATSSVPVNPAW